MNGFKQDDRHLTGEFIPFPHDASSFKKIREINISIVDLEDCIFSAEVLIKGMTLSKHWHIRNVIKMPKIVVNTHDDHNRSVRGPDRSGTGSGRGGRGRGRGCGRGNTKAKPKKQEDVFPKISKNARSIIEGLWLYELMIADRSHTTSLVELTNGGNFFSMREVTYYYAGSMLRDRMLYGPPVYQSSTSTAIASADNTSVPLATNSIVPTLLTTGILPSQR